MSHIYCTRQKYYMSISHIYKPYDFNSEQILILNHAYLE